MPAGFRLYKPLFPTREMLRMDEDVYRPRYDVILSRLDPGKVWDELHKLTAGAEPVLLCHERPPFTAANWCHRRIVAAWFEERLGVVVPEIEIRPRTKAAPDPAQARLF